MAHMHAFFIRTHIRQTHTRSYNHTLAHTITHSLIQTHTHSHAHSHSRTHQGLNGSVNAGCDGLDLYLVEERDPLKTPIGDVQVLIDMVRSACHEV
jgi:hypothetical protein